jgi:hypothetical protein
MLTDDALVNPLVNLPDWQDLKITEQLLEAPYVPCGLGNRDFPPRLAQCFCSKRSSSRSGVMLLTLYREDFRYEVGWIDAGLFDGFQAVDFCIARCLVLLGWSRKKIRNWMDKIQPTPDHELFVGSYQLWPQELKLLTLEKLEKKIKRNQCYSIETPVSWAVATLRLMIDHERKMAKEDDPWVLMPSGFVVSKSKRR